MKLTEWCRDLAWKYRNGHTLSGICRHVGYSGLYEELSGDDVKLIRRELKKLPSVFQGYKWPLSLEGYHSRADWLEALADKLEGNV